MSNDEEPLTLRSMVEQLQQKGVPFEIQTMNMKPKLDSDPLNVLYFMTVRSNRMQAELCINQFYFNTADTLLYYSTLKTPMNK